MTEPVMKDIAEILLNGRLCVLATTGPGGPHTSLMAYAVAADFRTLYLVTDRQSRKYQNMVDHPAVSMLIDTRCNDTLENTRALTVSGTAVEITEPGMLSVVRGLFVDRHPELADFLDAPGSAFVAIAIRAFQLLSGPRDARFIQLDESGS